MSESYDLRKLLEDSPIGIVAIAGAQGAMRQILGIHTGVSAEQVEAITAAMLQVYDSVRLEVMDKICERLHAHEPNLKDKLVIETIALTYQCQSRSAHLSELMKKFQTKEHPHATH